MIKVTKVNGSGPFEKIEAKSTHCAKTAGILKWFLQMMLFTLTLEQNPQKMTLKRDQHK